MPILPGDKSAKGIPVYLEMFDIDVSVIFGGLISELYVCWKSCLTLVFFN